MAQTEFLAQEQCAGHAIQISSTYLSNEYIPTPTIETAEYHRQVRLEKILPGILERNCGRFILKRRSRQNSGVESVRSQKCRDKTTSTHWACLAADICKPEGECADAVQQR